MQEPVNRDHPTPHAFAEKRANASRFRDRLALGSDETLLQIFLDGPKCSSRPNPRAESFNKHCSNAVLEELRKGLRTPSDVVAVWLDDRSPDKEPRSYNGCMSVKKFYKALRQKRFGQVGEVLGEPPAAIRRIHIPTPNPQAVAALVLTSTPTLAPVLGDFLCSHFDANKDISIRLPPDHPTFTFAVEFHMSYPVLRDVLAACHDHGGLDRPERTHDLSFLSTTEGPEGSNGKLELLHEAKASCMVAGYSKDIWDAYSLVDKSLEPDCNENNNSLLYYLRPIPEWAEVDITDGEQQSETLDGDADVEGKYDDGVEFDPVMMGELADRPHPDPKHYFLAVLKVRAEDAENEWKITRNRLRRAITEYQESPSARLLQQPPGTESARSHTERLERSQQWVSKTSGLIGELAGSLEGNIRAWDSFETRHGLHFNSSGSGEQKKRLARRFKEISDIYERLRRLQDQLKDLQNKCKRFQDQITRIVMVRGDRGFVIQHWTITLFHYSLPPTIASGIMQAEIIKFNPPIICFLSLSFFIGAIIIAMAPNSPLSSVLGNASLYIMKRVLPSTDVSDKNRKDGDAV